MRNYVLAGRALQVASNDRWSLRLLSAAYEGMEAPDAVAASHRAALTRDGRGLTLEYDGTDMPYACASDPDEFINAYHAVQELFARFASSNGDVAAIYGAAVDVAGAAVLLLGSSCVGKTVLAAHLADQGARFLGDETIVLHGDARTITAMPRRPALREPAVPLLPSRWRNRVRASRCKYRIDSGTLWYALHPPCFGGIEPDAAPRDLGAIMLLESRSASAECEEIPADAMLPHVVSRLYVRNVRSIALLRAAALRARCFRVQVGKPEETARLLLRTLS